MKLPEGSAGQGKLNTGTLWVMPSELGECTRCQTNGERSAVPLLESFTGQPFGAPFEFFGLRIGGRTLDNQSLGSSRGPWLPRQ